MHTAPVIEPDFQTAAAWWPDLANQWTPVGWKNHLFRFNVLWNGTVMAQPDLNRRTAAWRGQGLQLHVAPSHRLPDESLYMFARDHGFDCGLQRQGWSDFAAPVLWTDFSHDGVVTRQELFAHIPGGGDIVTGTEALFAWMRLSLREVCPGLPQPKRYGFYLKLYAPHLSFCMSARNNIRYHPERARYPRRLLPSTAARRFAAVDPLTTPTRPQVMAVPYSRREGLRLTEPHGAIRIGIPPRQACHVFYQPQSKDQPYVGLYVELDLRAGQHVDVLLPMLPTPRRVYAAEAALGYDRALREANRYWARPVTATAVRTPEPFLNAALRQSLKLAEVIAERNPADGHYSILNGSHAYADLWPTPGALTLSFLLDDLGCHGLVERYLEIFRHTQGTITPPGTCFTPHPGYLASPKTLTSIDWLTDHGALLWVISRHALLTHDAAFAARWTDPILRACEFIRYARHLTRHGGFKGILPPAVATDSKREIQGVWTDGWNYKGLMTALRLLQRVRHPRAAEFAKEADDYRHAFLRALRAKTRTLPQWTDGAGRRRHFVPTTLCGGDILENRQAFYLDAGPLFLVFAGLLDAADPLMRSTLEWFRSGPQTRAFRRHSCCWQTPCLDHEMSSCEPCYSWNIFHSHQAGDRRHFLEGMYSLFAGSLSRQTYISCETRDGITGNLFSIPLAAHHARLAVVDDEVRAGELHLLRLVPKAWLRANIPLEWTHLPTEFGPVSLSARLNRDRRVLYLTFKPAFHTPPSRIVLHAPPSEGLNRIVVNGQGHPLSGRRVILLTATT